MTTGRLAASLLAASLTVCSLQAQQPAAGRGRGTPAPVPPAPAPGSPAIYKSGDDLMEVLKKSIAAANGEQSSSAIANTDQYRVNIVHREKAAGALAHAGNTELHYIIEGSGTVVTGGTIVRPAGGGAAAATIQNGETRQLKKGDVIIVPAGSPHWYSRVDTPITYLEVRFVAPAK